MGFQQIMYLDQGSGIPGARYVGDLQVQVMAYTLNSTDQTQNIYGRAFTFNGDLLVQAGGTGVFAGFMVNPKQTPLFGTLGNPLAASAVVPNNYQAEFAIKGPFWVYLPDVANVGDQICFSHTDGHLVTVARNIAPPAGYSFAYAEVYRNPQTVAAPTGGIAIANINYPSTIATTTP